MGFIITKTTGFRSLNTYIISGGNSNDSLTDNLIDYIEAATYKISNVSYSYPGGVNIEVPLNVTNYKAYLYIDSDVHFASSAPPNSIIIATFDTDASKITRWDQSGQYSLMREINKINENINSFISLSDDGLLNVVKLTGLSRRISWDSNLKIHLLNKYAGISTNNIIQTSLSPVDLQNNECALVSINRGTDGYIIPSITVQSLSSVNSDLDKIILFINVDGMIYIPKLQGFEPYNPINTQLDALTIHKAIDEVALLNHITIDVIDLISGTNTYTLSGTPLSPGKSYVEINGVSLTYSTEFTISGNQITLIPNTIGYLPQTGMVLRIEWK